MPLRETDISAHPDELVRRILTLVKYNNFPLDFEDTDALLDILKVIADRIIKLEQKVTQ